MIVSSKYYLNTIANFFAEIKNQYWENIQTK